MARNRRHDAHRRRHQRPHEGTRHLHAVEGPQQPTPHDWLEALSPLRTALRAPSPAVFLEQVSTLMALAEDGGLESPETGVVTLRMLVEAMMATAYAEATAALAAMRQLTADGTIRAAIDAELPKRRHPLPTWLRHLDETSASSQVAHASDGTPAAGNLAFSLRFADTSEISVITFLDPDGGGVIRDAYLADQGLDAVVDVLDGLVDDNTSLHFDDPAQSRALLEHALGRSPHVEPLEDSATWPALRPLVRWAIGLLPPGGDYDPDDLGLDGDEWREFAYDYLLQALGSDEAIAALDDLPLPDEPFDWTGIPDDLRGTITEVLEWCDRAADELFGVEHRTAFRRFLARVAVAEPAILRRKASVKRTAAAVVWAVGRANDVVSHRDGITAKALMAWFGIAGTPSDRAAAMLAAIGAPLGYIDVSLGAPDLLTGARRAALMRFRDVNVAWSADDAAFTAGAAGSEPGQRGAAFGVWPAGPVHVTHRPGMAAEMLETLKPFLAEEGIDLDQDMPDLDTLNAAFARASAAYNLSLATPTGRARESVISALRSVVGLLVSDDVEAAFTALDSQVVPESRDGSQATVAGTFGTALTLLDTLLTGRDPVAPAGVARTVRVPAGRSGGTKEAERIIDLAAEGRAFGEHETLLVQGRGMLAGCVVALAAAARAWADRSGRPVAEVVAELIR